MVFLGDSKRDDAESSSFSVRENKLVSKSRLGGAWCESIKFSSSHTLRASVRMLSNERRGCVGARSSFDSAGRFRAKNEASDELQALRFIATLKAIELLLVLSQCSTVSAAAVVVADELLLACGITSIESAK